MPSVSFIQYFLFQFYSIHPTTPVGTEDTNVLSLAIPSAGGAESNPYVYTEIALKSVPPQLYTVPASGASDKDTVASPTIRQIDGTVYEQATLTVEDVAGSSLYELASTATATSASEEVSDSTVYEMASRSDPYTPYKPPGSNVRRLPLPHSFLSLLCAVDRPCT